MSQCTLPVLDLRPDLGQAAVIALQAHLHTRLGRERGSRTAFSQALA